MPEPIEPPAPRFGDRGVRVVTGAASAGISSTEVAKSNAGVFNVTFSPGADVFVMRGFSIGGDLDIRYQSTKLYAKAGTLGTTNTTTVAAGPRIGFNVRLGERFSWYPRLTVGLSSVQQESKLLADANTTSTSHTAAFVSIFAPLLVHPAPHFFFGAGPAAYRELGGLSNAETDAERTSVSGRFVVGGWWGGHAADEGPADAAMAVMAPHFGERGQWVFTGEAGGTFAWTTFGDGDTSLTTASISPGFDYFIVRRFSLGLAGSLYYAHDGSKGGKSNTTSVGLAPHIGGDIPLGRSFSLYPRASVSFSSATTVRDGGLEQSTSSATLVAIGAYVPLLVHVATHAFIGFGPLLSQEVSRYERSGSGNHVATTVGASLVVGGWL